MVKPLFRNSGFLLLFWNGYNLIFYLCRRRRVMRQHSKRALRTCPCAVLALNAPEMVDRPGTGGLINRNGAAWAIARAHAAQDASARIDCDGALQALRGLLGFEGIQKRLGLLEHARERHFPKVEDSHCSPTFPYS